MAHRAISEDDLPTTIHPHPTPVTTLSLPEWDGALHFCGSETDLHSPGIMEGAFGAAERVLRDLDGFSTKRRQPSTVDSKSDELSEALHEKGPTSEP